MRRSSGVLEILQACVYGAGALWAWGRFWPLGALLGLAALLEAGGGVALLAGRGPRLARLAAAISIVVVLFAWGCLAQVAIHVIREFTPAGGETGWRILRGIALSVPWTLVLPVGRLLAGGRRGTGAVAGAALLTLLLPPGVTLASARTTYAPVDGPAAAAWLHARLGGEEAGPAPEGPGPVLLVAAVVRQGTPVEIRSAQASDLRQALEAVAAEAPDPEAAVYLDVGVDSRPLMGPWLLPRGVAWVRPAETGIGGRDGVVGTLVAARAGALGSRELLPGLRLPGLRLSGFDRVRPDRRIRMRSWLASASGVVEIRQTWARSPALDAHAAREAALAGARFIARNQEENGRYAYIVKGPGGELGKGYNYPRHAGATWFLARVAARTGDVEVRGAAQRGLDYLGATSRWLDDGRAFVLDPSRRDGKAWVGTTSLALLAALALQERPDLQAAWTAQVASAVDADGEVCGDMQVASGTWPAQPDVTYAQGQGMLALAAALRAGVPGAREPLERAVRHVDHGYWPAPGGRLVTLDEHWMCLAGLTAGEVLGRPVGEAICRTYLQQAARSDVPADTVVAPASGPAGGLAEAMVALAVADRRAGRQGPWTGRALSYGRAFLAALYRSEDAPLLGRPERLLGGFRDRPWALDVQVDAVQHVGCALLGMEHLLAGVALPGTLP